MVFMDDSVRELNRFKFRKKVYSVFLIVGIILVTLGIISGMVMPDPLVFRKPYPVTWGRITWSHNWIYSPSG